MLDDGVEKRLNCGNPIPPKFPTFILFTQVSSSPATPLTPTQSKKEDAKEIKRLVSSSDLSRVKVFIAIKFLWPLIEIVCCSPKRCQQVLNGGIVWLK